MTQFDTASTDFDHETLSRLVEIEVDAPRIQPTGTDAHAPFPLTEIQRAYLLGRDPSLPLGRTNCQFYIELTCDDLDIPRYIKAWNRIVARHPMLRAKIVDGVSQYIPETCPDLRVPIHDLRSLDKSGQESALEAIRTRLARDMPADNRDFLIDVELTRLGGTWTNIHLRFDMLAADQHSTLTLLDEAAIFYETPDACVPAPTLTFRDYVLQIDHEAARKSALAYWKARAKDLPLAPQLPLLRPLETIDCPQIERLSQTFEKETWDALKKIAVGIGVTPSGLLLGMFTEALLEWTRDPHFCLNLTLFNRDNVHPDVDKVIGDFTSTLLLEVDMRTPRTREDLCRTLQNRLWKDMEYKAVSGMEVAREMALAKGHLDRPIMPVVFTSTLSRTDSAMIARTSAHPGTPVMTLSQTPQVVLDCQLSEWSGVLSVNWDITVNAVDRSVLQALFVRYCDLISGMVENPALKTQIVSGRLEPNADHIVGGDPNAVPVSDKRLADLWLERLPSVLSAPAIGLSDKTITHRALAEQVSGLAEAMSGIGIGPTDIVCLAIPKSADQIAACLAVSILGATYVPLDMAQPEARKSRILENLKPDLILHAGDCPQLPDLPGETIRTFDLHQAGTAPHDRLFQYPGASSSSLAYIIYTSGTTGIPKGVMITHEAAMVTIDDIRDRFNVGDKARVLSLSQLHFDLSVFDIFGILGGGGCLVLPDPDDIQNPAHWADLCGTHSVTLWNTVPGLFAIYVDYLETNDRKPDHPLSVVMLSGDWIPLDLPPRGQTLWPEAAIYSLGGATEAAIWSIFHKIDRVLPDWTSIPYGQGLSQQQIFVLDDNLRLCPAGQEGELFIAGRGLASGYFGDAEKTAHHFFHHPRTGLRLYRTGDLGCYTADGTILFRGRADTQVKINGYRVETQEIARILKRCPDVDDVLVLPVGEKRHPRLAAFIKATQSSDSDGTSFARLEAYLEDQLPDYMIPRHWLRIERWPLTSNGKVDHKALAAMVTTEDIHETPQIISERAPETSRTQPPPGDINLTDAVLGMVSDVLGGAQVTLEDNLVHLGATSLELIALANRIEKLCCKRPPLGDLARSVRITDLLSLVERLHEEGNPKPSATPAVQTAEAKLRAYMERHRTLTDAAERTLFKNAVRNRRNPADGFDLPSDDLSSLQAPDTTRRSWRQFATGPVSLPDLAALLGALRPHYVGAIEKRRYASAGGVYPVETYLLVPENGVEGLAPKAYRYSPETHRLVSCKPGSALRDFRTLSSGNQDWIAESRFLLLFAVALPDIVPLYDSASLTFSLIECGAMCQVLEQKAGSLPLGLCQIGDLPLASLSEVFGLSDDRVALHGLVGGPLDRDAQTAWMTAPKTFAIDLNEGTL